MRCKNIARLHFRHRRQRLYVAEMAFAMPMLFQVCFKFVSSDTDTGIVGLWVSRCAPPDRDNIDAVPADVGGTMTERHEATIQTTS
jgi:hypothetical protein